MDFAIVQPPIWTNARTPWEIGYVKSYLQSNGFEGRAYDLSLETLPLLGDFASQVDAATGSTFSSEVFTTSINFLTTVSEHLLIRMLYGDQTDETRRATAALLSVRTAWPPETLEFLAGVFMTTPYYERALDSLIRGCERIVAARPRVVGVVTHITSFGFGAFILREIKRLDRSIRTVLSGYQATISAEAALALLPWVDFVTVGEQEIAYRDLLAAPREPRQVVRVTECLALDAIPPADYRDLDMTQYQWMSVRASRNCPYRCAYCQENAVWDRFRVPAIEHIVAEVEMQLARHPQRHVDFVDLEMTTYAEPLARALLARGIEVEWSGWMRPAARTRQYMSLLTRSGCRNLTFGLESGSKRVLARMKRLPHGTPENIALDLASCIEHGIHTCLTAIAGFPGETEEDWEQTLGFFRDHADVLDAVGLQSFKALPRSPIAGELRTRSIDGLEGVAPLLYALNYHGSPSQRETIAREIEGRGVLLDLGLAGKRRKGLLFRQSRRESNLLDLR
jgi:hypothetical protein